MQHIKEWKFTFFNFIILLEFIIVKEMFFHSWNVKEKNKKFTLSSLAFISVKWIRVYVPKALGLHNRQGYKTNFKVEKAFIYNFCVLSFLCSRV